MSDPDLESALRELELQLELDELRGPASLPARGRGLRQARAAGDRVAERQALIDLAAVSVALAARLPAPRVALAERDALTHPARSRSRLRRRAA